MIRKILEMIVTINKDELISKYEKSRHKYLYPYGDLRHLLQKRDDVNNSEEQAQERLLMLDLAFVKNSHAEIVTTEDVKKFEDIIYG